MNMNENFIIQEIKKITMKNNIDNISRTEAYFKFFVNHPEIKWSFLASMVSRNGGYNMCDLEGEYFVHLIDKKMRKRLFLTYERANWLIFHDVFPQLLLYDYSTKFNKPLFHLMKFFNTSQFIQSEWEFFWMNQDLNRLTTALIINEQNVIQKPIIEHHVYKNKVFQSLLFKFEDYFHFSCVLFPTLSGEVYGASVNGFRKLDKRIDLGKRLADILFLPHLFPSFYEFAKSQTHTGSRRDYERFLLKGQFTRTPFLRLTFPIVKHHIHEKLDWSKGKKIPEQWTNNDIYHKHPILLSEFYQRKQRQIKMLSAVHSYLYRS
jgi:hypothetical protein